MQQTQSTTLQSACLLNESLQLLNLLGSSIACPASSLYKHEHVEGKFVQSDDHSVCKNNRNLRCSKLQSLSVNTAACIYVTDTNTSRLTSNSDIEPLSLSTAICEAISWRAG